MFFVGVIITTSGSVWVTVSALMSDITESVFGFVLFALGVVILAVANAILKSCV